ncbi:MAG TPA: hypothetical protein VED59_00755 [Acidimicrobiales bacterium]|nr:hypothetical protein [Acidimicrobiales bacterium]
MTTRVSRDRGIREVSSVCHYTLLELLDRLCCEHYWLKTHQGWALVPGRGTRAFVAPDDPRHPGHGQAA